MSKRITQISRLLATSGVGLVITAAGVAQAQQAAGEGPAVGEVVVTATRRADTVHNVPMAITAIPTEDLERRGLKTASDLTQVATSLRVSLPNSAALGGINIAIRGIAGGAGAPTTGIYVDDVALQQRSFASPPAGGAQIPNLFDLERVEVLKGPQGTLYGGSSEGGTVRFIIPQPSVTKRSLYARGEVSHTEEGDEGYEFGAALNTPIVQDKLGVRLSGSFRRDAGYVDHVSRFTGKVIPGGADTNYAKHVAFNAGVLFRPTERASITLAWLFQRDAWHDVDSYWENIPQYTFSTIAGPRSYGPFNMWGPYKTGQNTNIGDNFYTSDAQLKPLRNPHTGRQSLPSLTFEYDFDKMTVKSVTGLNSVFTTAQSDLSYIDMLSRAGTFTGPQGLPVTSSFIATVPEYDARFITATKSRTLTQEIRFASNDPSSRLSWVGGIYYYHSQLSSEITAPANVGALLFYAGGPATYNALGPIASPQVLANPNAIRLAYSAPQRMTATQLAAFGEATVSITQKLKATAGIRFTRDQFNYEARGGGDLLQGLPFGTLLSSGSVSESPITPKVGLQYVIDTNTNLYANASKGYRPGGTNNTINKTNFPNCAAALDFVGLPNGVPSTFGSDSLWSYEAGAKLRTWGGKANVNVSVFRIDWNNVQQTIVLNPCGQTFTLAAAKERSQGVDLQGAVVLFPGFMVTANVGYTDAKFLTTIRGGPVGAAIVLAGSSVPNTPKWTSNLSGEYRFDLMGTRAYLRGDWAHVGSFFRTSPPGTTGYQPDNYINPASDVFNARAGVVIKGVELSAFVNNLTNSTDTLTRGGIAGAPGRNRCTDFSAACTTYGQFNNGAVVNTFRPRTWGVGASYRY